MKIRPITTRLGVMAAACTLATAGLAALGADPASATIVTGAEPIQYRCMIGQPPGDTAFTGPYTVTANVTERAPDTVAPGASITVDTQLSLAFPAWPWANYLCGNNLTSETATAVIDGTGPVDQAAVTVGGAGLPAESFAPVGDPILHVFAPATFTAGSTPGTATFLPGSFSVSSQVTGGPDDGFVISVSCTAEAIGLRPPVSTTVGSPTQTSQWITLDPAGGPEDR